MFLSIASSPVENNKNTQGDHAQITVITIAQRAKLGLPSGGLIMFSSPRVVRNPALSGAHMTFFQKTALAVGIMRIGRIKTDRHIFAQ